MAADVIKNAAADGWEAGLLAFIIVCGLFFIGYWMKKDSEKVRQREDRMANRIDCLEDTISKIQETYSDRLVKLTSQVTEAILKSTDAQLEMHKCMTEMNATLRLVNTDIRDLCTLLRSSPCVALAATRGEYTITDKEGNRLFPKQAG